MCAASQVLRPGDYAQIRPDETTLVCLLSGVVFGYVSHMAWTSSSDANACSYDICRWERARIARRCSLDGERIHPHPGMPVERPPKQTALALTMVKKWEEREEEGRVIISYRHAAGLDDRLEIKTVTFPGGKSGHGMFAVRDFCKYEYITTWMGTPAAGGGDSSSNSETGNGPSTGGTPRGGDPHKRCQRERDECNGKRRANPKRDD